LKEAVAKGEFREDLFYRLNVVPIVIPPLRERREDILPLALDLLRHFNQELNRGFTGFTRAAAELLMRYPWPGNIRELKNVVERTMILAPDGEIDAAHLPAELRDSGAVSAPVAGPALPSSAPQSPASSLAPAGSSASANSSLPHFLPSSLPQTSEQASADSGFPTLRDLEDRYIEQVLASVNHNKARAARILGIHPTSLLRRLKKVRP
jgi:DNA-binding NtrC family response regulator